MSAINRWSVRGPWEDGNVRITTHHQRHNIAHLLHLISSSITHNISYQSFAAARSSSDIENVLKAPRAIPHRPLLRHRMNLVLFIRDPHRQVGRCCRAGRILSQTNFRRQRHGCPTLPLISVSVATRHPKRDLLCRNNLHILNCHTTVVCAARTSQASHR